MSTSTNVRPPRSSIVSIVSRVVPGTSATIVRSSPTSLLKSDDLPTFGRPRIATRIASSGRGPRGLDRQAVEDLVEQVAGVRAVQARDRERVAEAERVELEGEVVWPGSSILFASTSTCFFAPRRISASSSSPGRDALPRVDDEEHEVGLADRGARLLGDLPRDRARVGDVDAARVDQQEVLAVPLADQLLAVARRALTCRGRPPGATR